MRRRGELPEPSESPWWRHAVCYQVFVRSFADSDGDGIGDLGGVRDRLGYLELLGVQAVGLSPCYLSPNVADGYDVASPRAVDPVLGGIDAFERLVAKAHELRLRVVLDVVPGHTSDRHNWFLEALAAPRESAARLRYHFRDGRGTGGQEPPNDLLGADGAPAWTRADDGQWYRHLLGAGRPDLNWADQAVRSDFESTLRFWLDHGADGFRTTADHAPAESSDLANVAGLPPDPLHLVTDNRLAAAPFDADVLQATIESTLAANSAAGTPPVWTLTTHDGTRPVSRYGGGRRGLERARAMALVQLGLPGVASVFNGDELGLPDGDQGPRTAIPWEGGEPPFGFSPPPGTWVPMPREWATLTVESQLEDGSSTLSLYRHALELRRDHPACAGEELEWYGAPPGCFAYRLPGGLVCALNTSAAPVPLPPGEVLLASTRLPDGKLPADAAAWVFTPRQS